METNFGNVKVEIWTLGRPTDLGKLRSVQRETVLVSRRTVINSFSKLKKVQQTTGDAQISYDGEYILGELSSVPGEVET